MRMTTLSILVGLVLAAPFGLGQRSTSGSRGTAQVNPSASPKVYTYSVKLTGSGSYADQYYKENFKLTGSWGRLAVKVTDVEGKLFETPEKANGTIEGVWHYESVDTTERCIGDKPFSGTATAEIGGWRPNRDENTSYVTFIGNSEDIRAPEDDCPNVTFPNLWSRGSHKKMSTEGLEVVSNAQWGAGFNRRGGAGFFFPLDQLRDGKGFTVKSSDTVTDPHYTYTWSVEMVFTPGQSPPPPTQPTPQQDCSIYLKKRCEDLRKATWDLDDVLRNLHQTRAAEAAARVTEIQKLIDVSRRTCDLAADVEELVKIRAALEEWKMKHRDAPPRLGQSLTEGKTIWQRLHDVTDKICKKCCGGIGPSPPGRAPAG